jgi:hypothetical protein
VGDFVVHVRELRLLRHGERERRVIDEHIVVVVALECDLPFQRRISTMFSAFSTSEITSLPFSIHGGEHPSEFIVLNLLLGTLLVLSIGGYRSQIHQVSKLGFDLVHREPSEEMRAIWFSNLLNLRNEGVENIHFLAIALHERLENLPELVLTYVALYLSRLLNVFLVIVDGLKGFTDCGSNNLLSNVHLVGLKRVLLTHRSQVLPKWKQCLHL